MTSAGLVISTVAQPIMSKRIAHNAAGILAFSFVFDGGCNDTGKAIALRVSDGKDDAPGTNNRGCAHRPIRSRRLKPGG